MISVPRSFLVTALACGAVVAVLVVIWYLPAGTTYVTPPSPNPPYQGSTVEITDVDFIPDYYTNNSSTIGYLTTPPCYGSTPANYCAAGTLDVPDCDPDSGCANVTPSSDFDYNLSIVVNGSAYHTIDSIGVVSPFTLVSVSPAPPVKLPPGLPGVTFDLVLLAPSTPAQVGLEGWVACY